jgi:hypothetical protein
MAAAVITIVILAACSSSSTSAPQSGRRSPLSTHATSVSSPGHRKHTGSTSKPKTHRARRSHPYVPAVDLPRYALTSGLALSVTPTQVCTPGYATSVRDVSESEKAAVYDRYGVEWVPYQHEVDHLISLELGGSNAIRNLWPEPYAGRWSARTKDVLENRLHELVCDGGLRLRSAQRQEAGDWVAAYRKYVGSPTSVSSGSVSSPGGFFASSYPTASTIYCADDPAWHELSKTYLIHLATFARATHRFPGYHLHRLC